MGNICKSCCGSDDSQNDNDGRNERDPLINGISSRPQGIEPPSGEHSRTGSQVLRKNDEQSALNRILHKAASNVIDVAALDTHGMENHEFTEKAKAYSQKLATAGNVQLKNRSKKRELLPDCTISIERLIAISPLPSSDIDMMIALSANAEEAYKRFAVLHTQDLIVDFATT
ncbi:hypothetical protein RvY_09712-2 [Ramazzottius varieornatus]|uniref:Ragulator complex protein LAMTOR1 n=1 Tax=Ramazzottius varieornatus TaxID=947166 RepID=A0A1D1VCP0_RAMVA|nr:hypothetical protein RvY_09712-2 [Ramazzottius varieornatus]